MDDDQMSGEARHAEKMAKRKAVQDAEVASKTVEKGVLMVHTGPGKGKTTGPAYAAAYSRSGRPKLKTRHPAALPSATGTTTAPRAVRNSIQSLMLRGAGKPLESI